MTKIIVPFSVNSPERGQTTLTNFSEILLKISLSHNNKNLPNLKKTLTKNDMKQS